MVPQLAVDEEAPRPPRPRSVALDQSVDEQVHNALNLYLPLKSPAQFPALQRYLKKTRLDINKALEGLNYVHFARFLATPDGSALWVLTSYDGDLEPYVLDFVVVLGDVFTQALQFVRGAPRLPVQKYPRDFIAFVRKSNVPARDFSACPRTTVIDIQRQFGFL